MKNKEFENYLALVSRLLRLKRGQTEQIAVELRDHLELRVAELIESGEDVDEATRMALEEFGDAASLAGQFQFISEAYKRRWMMRFATLSVAGLFLVAVLVMAMWPDNARFGSPDRSVAVESSSGFSGFNGASTAYDDVEMSDSTRRTIEARRAMTREHTFNAEEIPFAQLLDEMTDKFELTFILDQSAKDDSLADDEPISFRTGSLPANKSFRLLLRNHNATYVIQNGIVRVISMDVANDPEYFTRRIFDVSDLLAKLDELESSRTTPAAVRGGRGGYGGGGGGLFCNLQDDPSAEGNTGNAQQEKPAEEAKPSNPQAAGGGGGGFGGGAGGGGGGGGFGGGFGGVAGAAGQSDVIPSVQLLVDAIKNTIVHDNWDETNGDGTIDVLGGLMIVNQTEEANEAIEELLQDMRYRFAQRVEAE